MFHLIPRPLHIAALRLAHAVRSIWWRRSSSVVTGCRVLVIDAQDRVLLIRHSYGSQRWMMPGGGLKRGEDVRIAAQREVREEVALTLDPIVELGMSDEPLGGGRNHIHLIAGWTIETPSPDRREVLEARFFSAADLPDDLARPLQGPIPGWITAAKAARRAAA
ncbi:MAG: NUDIX domain-containing protein [Novosphingobium sp.]